MKEYVSDIVTLLFYTPLMVFVAVLAIQAFRKKPNKIGPALKDSINRFS